jgi:hypothetical protein
MKSSFSRVILFSAALTMIIVLVNACKKDRPDTDTQSSVDNSICEGEFSRIFPQLHGIAVGDSGVTKGGIDLPLPLGGCPDYWIDSADILDGFPVTMWLYYGSDNDGDSIYEITCTGTDGKARQGIIKAVFDNHWNQAGSTVTMSLKNYYVNGIKFEGTVAVTRSGSTFAQTVSNGKCSKPSDWTILWNSSRTFTTLLGDTNTVNDDVTWVAGSASGTDRNGKAFSVDIDPNNPLKRTICPYITQGAQTIKLEGKKDRIIDYGDGTCDNIAVLTIDGNQFEFQLQ